MILVIILAPILGLESEAMLAQCCPKGPGAVFVYTLAQSSTFVGAPLRPAKVRYLYMAPQGVSFLPGPCKHSTLLADTIVS